MMMIEQAQSYFVSKRYNHSIDTCIQLLTKMHHLQSLIEGDVLTQLHSLSANRVDNDESMLLQDHCLSLIMQSLFEMNRLEDAIRVLSVYYGDDDEYKQYASFSLKSELLQLYIYNDVFDKADELIENLQHDTRDGTEHQEELKQLHDYLLQKKRKLQEVLEEQEREKHRSMQKKEEKNIVEETNTVINSQTTSISSVNNAVVTVNNRPRKSSLAEPVRKKRTQQSTIYRILFYLTTLLSRISGYLNHIIITLYNEREISIIAAFIICVALYFLLSHRKSKWVKEFKDVIKMASYFY
jgi:predicted PurR-regulated permease PerM